MKIDTYSFTLPSELKGTEIVGKVYTPMVRANAKAVFQIAHGMAEHIERYDEFCAFLASNGYAVYIHDHVGHGKSVKEDTELGFFGLEKGWRTLIDDCLSVNRLAASEFPGKPMIFFGHSMGSFVARAYTMLHSGNLSGAIYCGTSGANPAAGIAIWLADAVAHSKGSHYHSDFINTLAFGAYNKKIKPARTEFDWLTKDEEIVDRYIADPLCGFLFTACGYRDMFTLLKYVSDRKWYLKLKKSLPIYLIAGDCDPVGEYGKGVKQVYRDLKKTGHTDVTMKLYAGDRHEILNELDHQTVMEDILKWADGKIVR